MDKLTLEARIMDSNIPKSEAEWWAQKEITDLCARLEKAEKDAERYQFLRSADLDALADDNWGRDSEVWTGDKFDAAIDAAIKAQKEGKS